VWGICTLGLLARKPGETFGVVNRVYGWNSSGVKISPGGGCMRFRDGGPHAATGGQEGRGEGSRWRRGRRGEWGGDERGEEGG